MFRQWFVAHRSLILTIVGGVVIAALVTAFAITSTGFTAQQLNLNDSSVWVANGAQQAIVSIGVSTIKDFGIHRY